MKFLELKEPSHSENGDDMKVLENQLEVRSGMIIMATQSSRWTGG